MTTGHNHLPTPQIPTGRIPDFVAQTKSDDKRLLISFRYYNHQDCEVSDLIKNAARNIIETFKKVGAAKLGDLPGLGIGQLPVYASNDYAQVLNGTGLVSEDISLKEHKIAGTQRLFYFIEDNLFHVVLIKSSQFETKKVRK